MPDGKVFSLISSLPSSLSADESFRLCSNDSSVLCRCPTPRRRTCGPCGLSLHPPTCGLGFTRRCLRGLPVLVLEASRRAVGSSTTPDRAGTRAIAPTHVACRTLQRASASGLHLFGAQYPPHLFPCLRFVRAPRDTQRKTRGQGGSLILSREASSFLCFKPV